MYSTITTTSKQVLVWALMFTLVLSVFPTTVADETDDEWFYSIDEYVSDEDGDGYNDTIDIGYDPDTECDCDINITVYVDVYENGTVIDYLYDEHTINNGEYDWFSQDWTPEESGTFDFQVYMYDEWNNLEDYWNVTGIELEPMTGSADETINVDNMVGDYHDDGINNDMGMFAFVKNDAVENVEISVEYFNGVIWTYYANGTTDDNGEFLIENATNGEYRWNAEYDGDLLEEETVSYTEIDAATNLSHQLTIDDWDDAGDYDDFLAAIFEGNDTKDDGYVEVYDEDGDLYDSGNTDDEYYGYDVYVLYDVEEGNYTFNLYYEEDGELLQSGWLHSYGSSSTNYDEWFYDWDYEVYSNDTITIGYDPDTECECDVDITVYVDAYENETGDWAGWTYAEHQIYNGESDWFEQNWTAYENGSYDFYVGLYDENDNFEDEFWIYDVYLESDGGGGGGGNESNDEWFYDWDYDVDPSDTITIGYDPDTECDCNVTIHVYVDIYDNATGDYLDYTYEEHEINNGYYDWFEQSWTADENGSYDFNAVMYDGDWNEEDDFWIYDVSLTSDGGGGGGGNESNDEWFYDWDYDVDPSDTITIGYDPDTECDCDVTIHVYVDIYDNETGDYLDYTYAEHEINNGYGDWFTQNWTAYENGSYDFNAVMYDEDWNEEDDFWIYDVYLSSDGGGGGDEDYDEWFSYWDYDVTPSDTITIGFDPDTECDCTVDVSVSYGVYDNETGDLIEWGDGEEYVIYGTDYDWFEQSWTASEDGSYDFYVYMVADNGDGDWEFEDEFWIYDVYLSYDYDEWIHAWIHYVPQDENGNNIWDEIVIGYDPETECDCDVNVSVLLEVYDENGDLAADSQASHTINGEQEDWFLQELSMNIEPGVYDFYVTMYDEEGYHEEQKSFSLIMSDEWLDYDWAVEDGNVKIDLQGNTNYDGEIDTYYEANVYRWNEDENDWVKINELSEDATISSESPAPIHFEWEAEESGDYRFVVNMADGMGQEDSFDFMEEINLNQAPVIEDLNVDHLFEGQLFNFEVNTFDADDDELEYTWDMGDGSPEKDGDSVRYGYEDDGVYIIQVSVSDGEFTTVKEFEMIVENMAPALEVSFDNEADEGSELSFAAQVNDVASDDVTVTWTFADGSRVEGTFAQYTFRDNGEYLVVVVAEDEDGGTTMEQLLIIINNVAPSFTQFVMPSGAEEGEALDFMVSATDPGDDTITYTFNFGDGTAVMMTPDGNISHKFADGDTFTIIICAQDEDGGENCRTETLPVSILEQMEEEGLLPGFGVLGALSALGVIGILRRRTH